MGFLGKKFLVIGLGVTGIKSSLYLNSQGAVVKAIDEGSVAGATGLKETTVEICERKVELKDLLDADAVIVSPGIRINMKAGVIKEAIEQGVKVYRDTDFFAQYIDEKIIAVTGTNGKSTVVTLLSDILREAGKKVFLGGNIGRPIAEYLIEGTLADYLVLELSSFQLETKEFLKPNVALVLNITPDHLDRYEDFMDYAKAKMNIAVNQDGGDMTLINLSDEASNNMYDEKSYESDKVTFSIDPAITGASVYLDGDKIVTKNNSYDISERKIQGRHNLENIVAAVAVADYLGADKKSVEEVIKNFKGLRHRMELVRTVSGVEYYNDSKATNVGSLESALKGLDKKEIIIAGGVAKGGDFTPLKALVGAKVKALVLVGMDKDKINDAVGSATETYLDETLEGAVRRAYLLASPGDKVMLCPGCASFDMFKNYEERGDAFTAEVKKL